MKKTKLLNSEISYEISKMGHYDTICICDAGLPIPNNVKRIDLALTNNIPAFSDVLKVVLTELEVQKFVIAEEIETKNFSTYKNILSQMGKIEMEKVSHANFKELTKKCRAIIRTGEISPFANIILESGVAF